MRAFFTQLLCSGFLFSQFALAQSIDVKDVKTDDGKTTTIEIRKGEKAQKNDVKWEIVDGTADISGEHNPLKKDARADWKKACDTWKRVFKEENKENKIINMNCGEPKCVSETEGTQCKSLGNYKVKTRIED